MATMRELEDQHLIAEERREDKKAEKAEKKQATIDELISDQWNTLTSVEDETADQADILAPIIMKCEQGVISHEQLGKEILSELSRVFQNNAERLLE